MASVTLELNSFVHHIQGDSVITESGAAPSLEEVAAQIVGLANEENSVVLRSAIMAAQLKRRLKAGEAGEGVKWAEWMVKHVRISKSHLYALVEIGSASDPVKALERWRCNNRERAKNRISASHLSDNHLNMLKLVRKLTDDEAKTEYLRLWTRYPGLI